MGLKKVVSVGKILDWPSTLIWGEVAHMLDICGPPLEYGNTLWCPAMHWPLLWVVRLATNSQQEAEGRVKN